MMKSVQLKADSNIAKYDFLKFYSLVSLFNYWIFIFSIENWLYVIVKIHIG